MGNARIRPEMTDKLLRKMHQAGCIGLWYGVESGSQRILNKMKKGYDLETAKKVIHDTARNGIRVLIFMIVDFPGETRAILNNQLISYSRIKITLIKSAFHVSGFCMIQKYLVTRKNMELKLLREKMGENYSYLYSPMPESNRYEIFSSAWKHLSKQKTPDQTRNNPIKIIVPYY